MANHRDHEPATEINLTRPAVPIVPGLRPRVYGASPRDAYVHDTGPVPSPDSYTQSFAGPDLNLRDERGGLVHADHKLEVVPRKGHGLMEAIGEAALVIYRVTVFITCLALLLALWRANQLMDGLGNALSDISTSFNNLGN
jgi:hypothetical protein